jgi:hypothetical protein
MLLAVIGYAPGCGGAAFLQTAKKTQAIEAPPGEDAPADESGQTVSKITATRGVLWSAGHENGTLNEWWSQDGGGIFNTGTGAASVSTAVAHSGRYSARLDITGAANDTQAVRLFRWAESSDLREAYYSAWFYFPQHYTTGRWWNIFQFKSRPDDRDDSAPTWTVNVGNRPSGAMYLYLWGALNGRSYSQDSMDLPEQRWVHIEAYFRRSTRNDGAIRVWQDGVLLWEIFGVRTAIGDNVHWSLTNYTDNITPSAASIYVDDAAISHYRIGEDE